MIFKIIHICNRICCNLILRCVWDANSRKDFALAWKMAIRRLTAGISSLPPILLLVSWSLQSAGRMSSSEVRDRSFCTHKSWPYIIIQGEEKAKKYPLRIIGWKIIALEFQNFGSNKVYQIYAAKIRIIRYPSCLLTNILTTFIKLWIFFTHT